MLLALFYVLSFAVFPFLTYKKAAPSSLRQPSEFRGDSGSGPDRAALAETFKEALDVRLHLIAQATKTLEISTYSIIWGDNTRLVFSALQDAAERGVRIRFVLDGVFAGLRRGEARSAALALASYPNVEIRYYNPINPLKPWTYNGRLHDKYFIADGKLLLLGGRNLGDTYYGEEEGEKPKYDRDIFVVNSGAASTPASAVTQVRSYFDSVWNCDFSIPRFHKLSDKEKTQAEEEKLELRARFAELAQKRPQLLAPTDYSGVTVSTRRITLLTNPINITKKEPVIWEQLVSIAGDSGQKLLIQTPYIVLNNTMQNDLSRLSAQTEVELLTNSPASCANLPSYADYYYKRDNITRSGVSIREYQGLGSLHAKSLLIGDDLSAVGSFNLDIRSAYIDTEVMLVVDGAEFNRLLADKISAKSAQSLQVNQQGNGYLEDPQVLPLEMPAFKGVLLFLLSKLAWSIRFLI